MPGLHLINPSKERKLHDQVSKEELEKRPYCHRLFIPQTYGEQVNVPGVGNGVQVKSNFIFAHCLEKECAIWIESKKKCGDRVQAESQATLAEIKEKEFAMPSIHDVTGG